MEKTEERQKKQKATIKKYEERAKTKNAAWDEGG